MEEKSGVCFGLRLQTQIEIPLHVQPVVLNREMHFVSAEASPSAALFILYVPVYISFTLKNA